MPDPSATPPESARILARKRTLLRLVIALLLAAAVAVLALPLRLPFPARLAAAGADVIAALVVFTALRQSRPRR